MDAADERVRLRLGGMALANGLIVHGPTYWAVAVRGKDGEIVTRSGAKPRFGERFQGIVGLRGVARLAEAIAILPMIRRAVPEARMPFESPLVVASALTAFLLGGRLRRRLRGVVTAEVANSLLGLAPAILALRAGDVAAYHGAEHMAISAYETGREDPALAAKEHERCGSHLVAPMLAASVASEVGLQRVARRSGPLTRTVATVAGVAASVELLAWCERHPDTPIARAVLTPGFKLQKLVGTRTPTEPQLDVGRAAIAALLGAENAAAADRSAPPAPPVATG